MIPRFSIALLGGSFGWGGGVDLLRIFANALLSQRKTYNLKIYLLLPVSNKIDTAADLIRLGRTFLIDAIINKKFYPLKQSPCYEPSFINSFQNLDGHVEIVFYNNTETGLTNALKKIKIDVVLPVLNSLGRSFPFPWIGYIYDFQHKYYPQYFTGTECLTRDILFATTLRDADAVIVNARSVKGDIDTFFPYHTCNIFNLPFAPTPVRNWLSDPPYSIVEKYKLPQEYFIISNQFWIHKSHITAFEALSLIRNSYPGRDMHLICTGNTDDYRFPNYFSELQRNIAALGLKDKIHILGHIPKEDQIHIMKKSIAVLQPTLFEGGPGGGAVYDAVSLGVPVVVSDIPVNKEVNADHTYVFRAGSSNDMAAIMSELMNKTIHRASNDILLAKGEKLKSLLGDRLLEAICYVTDKNRTKFSLANNEC